MLRSTVDHPRSCVSTFIRDMRLSCFLVTNITLSAKSLGLHGGRGTKTGGAKEGESNGSEKNNCTYCVCYNPVCAKFHEMFFKCFIFKRRSSPRLRPHVLFASLSNQTNPAIGIARADHEQSVFNGHTSINMNHQ